MISLLLTGGLHYHTLNTCSLPNPNVLSPSADSHAVSPSSLPTSGAPSSLKSSLRTLLPAPPPASPVASLEFSVCSHMSKTSLTMTSTHSLLGGVRNSKCKDAEYIPRPRNAFMIFKSMERDSIKQEANGSNEKNICKVAGAQWSKKTPEEKTRYLYLAMLEQRDHQLKYPGWKYRSKRQYPQCKTCKNSTRTGNEMEKTKPLAASGSKGINLAEMQRMVDEFDRQKAAPPPVVSLPRREAGAQSRLQEGSEADPRDLQGPAILPTALMPSVPCTLK